MKVMVWTIAVIILFLPGFTRALNPADITHNSGEIFYANPVAGEIKIKTKKGAITEAYLISNNKSYKMDNAYQTDQTDYYQVEVGRFDSTLLYHFFVKNGTDSLVIPKIGEFTSNAVIFETPAWAAGKTYYSVFPDGFFNGDAANDPKDLIKWGGRPEKWRSYGGDLTGIILKLPYLDSLDYDILLLQPIFTSASNHKLNPRDYATIDPAFGDTAVFKVLINEIHKRQKKIVLAVTVTQTGTDFAAFADLLKNGNKSKFATWYAVNSFPPKLAPGFYDCWLNDLRFPKLNLGDNQVKNYFIGYFEFWQHFGIDGFDLTSDVKINRDFLREIRTSLRSRHPDLLLIGSDTQGFTGDGLDGCENPTLNKLLIDYFVRDTITLTEFDQGYRRLLFFNPTQANVLNLLAASTDFNRIAAFAKDDALRMIYAFIFTACGSPMLMYGDEVGFADGAPLNPGSFIWNSENQNRDLLLDIKKLIYIRKTNPQIASKYFYSLYVNDLNNIYAYDRGGIITVLNSSATQAYLELPAWDGSYLDLFSGERFFATGQKLRLSINPKAFRILRRGV
jgi:glycosidase